jgi:creatinine amidohydrolase
MNIFLQNLSTDQVPELVRKSKGVIIIPIGSTEQHGNHLPLGTDTFVAEMLAADAARITGSIVAPAIWFGWSPHHMVLPGTITIRPEILVEYLYDVIESLSKHQFNKIILINGHRIVNIPWMQIAAERAQRKLGVRVLIFDPAYMSKSIIGQLGLGAVGHAEEIETSHMLYKHPNLVNLQVSQDNSIQDTELYSVDPRYGGDTLCYVPSTVEQMRESVAVSGGTSGEPSKSSVKKGEVYHNHLVNNLVKVINNLKSTGEGVN